MSFEQPRDRPQTTAQRPPNTMTTTGPAVNEEEEDEEEDAGMFAFFPPAPASAGPTSPASSHPLPPNTAASAMPYSPDMFNRAPNPDVEPASTLSPAAAYALAASRQSDMNSSNTHRRGSYPNAGTPEAVLDNPYEVQLNGADHGRNGEGSGKAAAWSGPSRSDSSSDFGIELDDYERAAHLQHHDGPDLSSSTDEKMASEHDAFADYEYEDEEDSPFPEVRASVSNIDDTEMPCLTFRTWFLGIFFAIVITAVNTFFFFRYPAPSINPILVQILADPLGKVLAWVLPITVWRLPRFMTRIGLGDTFSLNPGPFNIKEHTSLVIIANIATTPALALNFTVASSIFYGVEYGPLFDILLVMTASVIGFGVAGLCRPFLVWPAAMIWPQNLVYCTLLNTLHAEEDDDEDAATGMPRVKFLTYVLGGAFFWYFLPGFLFTALSAFSFACWIAPQNVVVNQLFGVSSGLGMSLLTLDWSQIAFVSSPLVVPWWAQVNVFAAFVLAFWVISPAMYYSNVWDSAYLPISTSSVFDRFGMPYDTASVIDPASLSLNITAYEEYSPLYLPVTYATAYGLSLMLVVAMIVHTVIYHGRDLFARFRRLRQAEDIHMKLMKAYPEVPEWWYLSILVVSVALSIVVVACWDTQMPVWSLITSLAIGFSYVVPAGFIYAMANTPTNINLILQIAAGYMLPGRPLNSMLFKTYAAQIIGAGLTFVQDLKLGHYMKIPPRVTYTIQVTSSIIGALVQVGMARWLRSNVTEFCSLDNTALLICPQTRVYYSASIIWGLIGPQRIFGQNQPYRPLLLWMIAGALAPLLTWALTRRYPKSWVRLINVPVALAGCAFMPPATGINYSSWVLVGFIFQFILRRYRFRWWSKYNFVLSAGLDAGTVMSALFIFLTLQLPKAGTIAVNWWGNTVYTETLDWQGASYLVPPEEGFGRTTWS